MNLLVRFNLIGGLVASSDLGNQHAFGGTYHVRWSAMRAIFNGHEKTAGGNCAEESAQCDVSPYNNDVVFIRLL